MRIFTFFLSLFAISLPVVSAARSCQTSSGAATITIVELYTSEGCDSCPPADKWFSTLKTRDAGAILLAFHVDYWDYIGWRDSFGRAAFSLRQRESVKRQGGRVTYTPQVVLDGRDFRSWRSWDSGGEFRKSLSSIQSRPARAQIDLAVTINAATLDLASNVVVDNALQRNQSAVFLAITEDNLVSRVSAGENKGVTLKHDHVVRELIGPLSLEANGKASINRSIALGTGWKPRDLSAVIFVQDQKSGAILQALKLPVCVS